MKLPDNYRMVVFDDDPTGIQTVHSCLLVTEWSDANLQQALADTVPFFYILTNTRALTAQQATERLTDALQAVLRVNQQFGYQLICVSRSDSCLRGHFPLETDVMCQVLSLHGIKVWPKIPFVPAFIESGRYTIDGIHYMREGQKLVPVSETEFARDNVFGYHSSRLIDYIVEKGGNPEEYEIVDAYTYGDLDAYRDRLFAQISDWSGSVVIRSSSSLPRSMSGIPDHPLLSHNRLHISPQQPGTFIIGSHVQKTTQQLNELLKVEGVRGLELAIDRILEQPEQLLSETLQQMSILVELGLTPVVYTSRREVRIDDAAERQLLGLRVSDFLVSIVQQLPYVPSYLVAKGGITSHDILCRGLNIQTARVMGQVINSVPCVMGPRFPYIIFPGNVGTDDSLREIFEKLRH